MMKLENKVAIITGSTRGIGRATAKLFAAEGAKVVVVGTNAELGDSCVAEIKADGGEAIFCKTDVTSEESLAALVKAALDTYGRIDILVNNAGVGGSTANMNDITMDEWNKVLATNLTAPFMLCKKVIPVMEEQGGGAIVNIASMLSYFGGIRVPAYAASKGAVAQLTKSLAIAWAGRSINVNAIAPGYMDTEMNTALISDAQRNASILARIVSPGNCAR